MKREYIDNKKFYEEIVKYVDEYNDCERNNLPLPVIPDYIGDCFMKIATNLAHKKNFAGYRYKDEMISDGIFDCIRYAHKFNKEKTQNPFSYYTQICFYAFLRKIGKEKKKLYETFKTINASEIFGMLHTQSDADDLMIIDSLGYSDSARETMNNFIKEYEEKIERDKQKKTDREEAIKLEELSEEILTVDETEID